MGSVTDKYDERLDTARSIVSEVLKEINTELGIGPEGNPNELDCIGEEDMDKGMLILLAQNVYDTLDRLDDTGT